ncbi:Sodium/glucose cotransporter 1 [Heterocephalus glaber]|uniref:Sodium/glucose cotransporter 1 n=1 Tax=Heterocephalus glaber TaxID=10181 RepID=G5B622_HETGA|nr:Sodium/glucose cotransporter 1 [Heterocephalus glaber]
MDLPENHDHFWNWSAMGLGTYNWKDALILTVYLVLVLYIGLRIAASLFAANIGSSHFIGLAGIGASSGIAVGAFEWNVVTLPEYLRKRFGSVRIQLLASILSILIDVITRILVEVCYGAMFVKIAWDMDVYQVTMLLLVIAGIYTITGGLAAVIYTEALHAIVMLVGSILLMIYAFRKVGGYKQLQRNYFYTIPGKTSEGNWTAKPECYIPRQDAFHIFRDLVSGDFAWPKLILGATTISLFYGCADQVSVQRGLAGKNISHMKAGFLLYGYLKLLPMFLMVMPGMISRIFYPNQVACVVPSECEKYCGAQRSCSPVAYPRMVVSLLPTSKKQALLLRAIESHGSLAPKAISGQLGVSVQRGLAGKNISHMKAGFLLYGYLKLLPMFLMVMPGMISRIFYPNQVACVVPSECEKYCGAQRSCSPVAYPRMVVSLLPTSKKQALLLRAIESHGSLAPKAISGQLGGAFWGLTLGIVIGFFRLLPEVIYGHRTCEKSKCPMPICSIHYLYFSTFLLLVSLLSMLGISFFTRPIPDRHLYRLCWSLRKSLEERLDLDRGITWRRLPRFPATPAMFRDSQSYFWEAFQLFFGLEPQLNPKVASGKVSKEINTTEEMEATEKRKHSDSLEVAEALAPGEASRRIEVREKNMEQGDPSESADILAQGDLSRNMKATKEKTENTDRGDKSEKSCWRRLISASATILIALVVFGHIYFA